MSSYSNWFLVVMLCISPNLVRCQMPGCSFQGLDLVPCLSGNTTEACCKALNHALTAGHQCLCSILASTNLLLASSNPLFIPPPLGLAFPGCYLSVPSLAACQVPLQMGSPPVMNEKPVLAPIAITPEPKPTDDAEAATNLIQSGKPQLVTEVPNSSKNVGQTFNFGSPNRSSSARPEIERRFHMTIVWAIPILAWIL